jgi:hypothetical protein
MFLFFFFFLVLWVKLRASCILGKHCTTELHPQPICVLKQFQRRFGSIILKDLWAQKGTNVPCLWLHKPGCPVTLLPAMELWHGTANLCWSFFPWETNSLSGPLAPSSVGPPEVPGLGYSASPSFGWYCNINLKGKPKVLWLVSLGSCASSWLWCLAYSKVWRQQYLVVADFWSWVH